MRKLLTGLLLSLFVLLVQHGALLHAVEHLGVQGSANGLDPDEPGSDVVCNACVASSFVSGAMPITESPFALRRDLAFHSVHACSVPSARLDAPPTHSRGPPIVL
jgi:hypothetical protein